MQGNVDATIANLRTVVKAKSNADLARKLGVDQSTISSWRARGRVPEEFVEFLKDPASQKSRVWQELTDCTTAVALLRYTLLRQDVAKSRDIDHGMSTFLTLKPWWLIMHRAAHELRLRMDALGIDLKTSQALIMQDDLRDPDATARRIEQHLAEDLKDSQLLENYNW